MKQFNNEYSSLSQIETGTIDYRCYENKARTLRARAFIEATDFSLTGKLYSSMKKMMSRLLSAAKIGARNTNVEIECARNPATC